MIRAVVLFVGAIAGVGYLILDTGQMKAFMEVGPFVFVFAGGMLLALGVTDDHDSCRFNDYKHSDTDAHSSE